MCSLSLETSRENVISLTFLKIFFIWVEGSGDTISDVWMLLTGLCAQEWVLAMLKGMCKEFESGSHGMWLLSYFLHCLSGTPLLYFKSRCNNKHAIRRRRTYPVHLSNHFSILYLDEVRWLARDRNVPWVKRKLSFCLKTPTTRSENWINNNPTNPLSHNLLLAE